MKKSIAFELFFNEIDFIKPQILLFHKHYPDIPIKGIVQNKDEMRRISEANADLNGIVSYERRKHFERGGYASACLFMTTEQWRGIPDFPSYCCFHGQPAKGLTLQPHAAKYFTGFFLLGPLQRKVVEDYYNYYSHLDPCPTLYNIGYPKSDSVINGDYCREKVLSELGLPVDRPTILYAPAFNEYASMRERGAEIIEALLTPGKWNILAKLAVDCWQPSENLYANGGIDWFKALERFEQDPNFRLYKKMGADPLLAASDVMVTDVSSIAFEFLVLGKPVIYIDTPKFFSRYLKMYFPHEDTESWENRAGINGGREFGVLIKDLRELAPAIEEALTQRKSQNIAEEMQQRFLYNPGRATEVFVNTLHELYLKHATTSHLLKAYRNKASRYVKSGQRRLRRSWLGFLGKIGESRNYIGCAETVAAAKNAGLSINDYLESREETPKKIGRRDRIIATLKTQDLLDINGKRILEIGAGAGRFLEKTIAFNPARYEVYELDKEWSRYLAVAYGRNSVVDLQVHNADGKSLGGTPNSSCDCIYAHGVFIYTPFVVTVGYLCETARVCRQGGKVCFDLFYDSDWGLQTARSWAHHNIHFPVVLSRKLMEGIYEELGFSRIHEFTEIYGASYSRYIVLEKIKSIRT